MSEKAKLPWIPGLKRPKFTLNRIKVSIPTRIPPQLIYGLIYLSILYIYIGGVYDLVEEPFARGPGPNGEPVLIYQGQDRQFLIEGLVAGVVMFIGAAGLYMLNVATNDPHNPDRATSYQIIGVILIFFAYFVLQTMFGCKTGNGC